MTAVDDPSRWASLLQPIKQLEKNWDVDIAAELTDYIQELASLTFEVDGLSNLNFAEAAMVVYSSSCTYGKKVEHLMKLVKAALDGAKAKHTQGGSAQRKRKTYAPGEGVKTYRDVLNDVLACDCDPQTIDASLSVPLEAPELHPALLVDVANAAASQTVANQGAAGCATGEVHAVGYVHEAHGRARSAAVVAMTPSDAPSFSTMRCHVHPSGALLLVDSEGDAYDLSLQSWPTSARVHGAAEGGRGAHDSAPDPHAVHAAFGSPVAADAPSRGPELPGEGLEQPHSQLDRLAGAGGDDLWYGDDGGDDAIHDGAPASPPCGAAVASPLDGGEIGASTRGQDRQGVDCIATSPLTGQEHTTGGADGALAAYGPRLLDPHDVHPSLKERPFASTKFKVPKFQTALKVRHFNPGIAAFPDAVILCGGHLPRFEGLIGDDSGRDRPLVNDVDEQRGRELPDSPLVAAREVARPTPDDAGVSGLTDDVAAADNAEVGPVGDGDDVDVFGYDEPDDDVGADYVEQDYGTGLASEAHEHQDPWGASGSGTQLSQGSIAYDNLVAQYTSAVAAAAMNVQLQSSLSSKVTSWQHAITDAMGEQEAHPSFDIRETGHEIVARAEALSRARHEPELSFSDIVQCSQKYEVARCFTAFLQQVNDGSVDLIRGAMPRDPFLVRVS